MRIRISIGVCLLALAQSACTTNNVVLVAPQAMANRPAAPSCWRPEDKERGYHTPQETNIPTGPAERGLYGCAAVIFQLTRDGKATHISVLREFPTGSGMGAIISERIRQTRYTPPASEDDWYYRAIGVITTGAPAANRLTHT